MGDFNVNLLNAETNSNISEFYDNLWSHCFAPCILQPTRLTKNSKTLIDNIFLNSIEFEIFSGNLTSLISDHLPQLLMLKDFHRKLTVTNNIVYERNYRFLNDNEFKSDLKSIPWENILSQVNLSASSAFVLFFKQIITLLDEHAPIHKLSKKQLSFKKKAWINRSTESLMRERDKLFKSYCQVTNPTIKLTKRNDYKRIRNIVVSKIKESKKQYYQNYFQRNSKNLKKSWGGMKSVVTLKSKAKTSPNFLFIDSNIIANKLPSLIHLIYFL